MMRRTVLAAWLSVAALGAARAAPSGLQVQADALAARGFTGEFIVARWDGQQGRTLLSRRYGLPGAEPRWRWASVSKQVAAVLAMQAQQRGLLSLDDPVRRHWPEWAGPADVTLRQLLLHTSGLPNPDATPASRDGMPGFYRRGGPVAQEAAGFCAGPALAPAGHGFSYNNCDTLVLAEVLARVEHQPYSALVQGLAKRIGARTLRLVEGDEGPTPLPADAPQPRLARFGAAGALQGQASDLVAFDLALVSGRLLDEVSRAELWRGDPKLGYVAPGAWAFTARLRGCAAPVELVERRGDVGGVQVRNLLAPRQGVALVLFTPDAEREFGELWQGRGLMFDLASAAVCGAALEASGAEPR
jgi:CubicO group peptidase (beta-lactamase class C family)